jgi:mono/diheme cytochrome c family protein
MRTIGLIMLLSAAVFGASLLMIASKEAVPAKPAPPKKPDQKRIERGRYLVNFGGCNDCHTPLKFGPNGAEPDLSRLLSGHPETVQLPPPPKLENTPWFAVTAGLTAWSGPWGISYAPNLTPDQNTGLGIWTEEMFISAMRTGRHMGSGRPILPPMPWQGIGQLTDDDLKAVFAYLRSIPPLKNRVPEPVGPDGKPQFE